MSNWINIETGDKFHISPSGDKSWSVWVTRSNGMVTRVATYRSYEKAAFNASILSKMASQ